MPPLEPGEHILLESRKHWLILAIGLAGIVFAAVVPLFIVAGIWSAATVDIQSSSLIAFASLYASWLLMCWVFAFRYWTDYWLDVWIVTNRKVIDVEQRGMFNRHVSTLHLEKVQDVTVSVEGIIPTMLKYGDLIVQSAGIEPEFTIRGVVNPNEMKEAIIAAYSQLQTSQPLSSSPQSSRVSP